mmetsp:Transcript_41623/g.107769  ORF Transcript_41623/g.107769 Transcript_41623/m.107769 type:complete len:214 (-) Transcript_41623:115-756(-)
MARGLSPPPSRRSGRLARALAEAGNLSSGWEPGRLAPLTPNTPLFQPKQPPQRPFVTDLRLSPAQRVRSAYSPHWLDRVEAPGCGLVPENHFHVHSYAPPPPRTAPAGLRVTDWPFAKDSNGSMLTISPSRSMEVQGLRVARTASEVVSASQFRSRVFYERKPITMRSTHNPTEIRADFDRGHTNAPRLKYKDRLKLFHTFDGRVIHSKLMRN